MLETPLRGSSPELDVHAGETLSAGVLDLLCSDPLDIRELRLGPAPVDGTECASAELLSSFREAASDADQRPLSQSAVIAAWANMQSWIEGTLPGLAVGTTLSDDSYSVPKLDTCDPLNHGAYQGGAAPASWVACDEVSLHLTSTKISILSGVAIAKANFVDATTVHLPFSFTKLSLHGDYSYSQNCQLTAGFGKKKGAPVSVHGSGTFDETVSNSTLTFVAEFTTSLTVKSAEVDASPTISLAPKAGAMAKITDAAVHAGLKSELHNCFASAPFSTKMQTLLNSSLGS